MSLRHVLPYVAIVLVGQAVLDAGPAIVAEREGGMGLGSALIAAQVAQIAGIVFGAVLAVVLVDRRSAEAALLCGAFLYYAGLMATGVAPMGSLVTVVAGMGVAGVGFGGMLTAAFSAAAAVRDPRARIAAVLLLLAAPIAARIAVGWAFAAGPAAFVVGGAAVVGVAVAAARRTDLAPRRISSSNDSPEREARSVGSVAWPAVVLGVGTMLSIAGADPSRLSASLIAGSLGMGGFDSIDVARGAVFAAGMLLLLAGAAMLLTAAERAVRIAAPGLLLVGLAGSGVAAAVTQAMTAGRMPDGSSVLIGAVGAATGGVGLVTGGMLIVRGREARLPALIGSATVTAACALGWLTLNGQRPEPGDVMPVIVVGLAGIALGLVAVALRVALTEVPAPQRAQAAGAGVVAAVIGSALGALIGAGEGVNTLTADPRAFPIGLGGFVIAGVAAIAVVAALRDVGASGTPGEARVSRTPS